MSTCKTGVTRFVSGHWVYLATILRGVSQIDQIRMAKDALATSIKKIRQQEEGLRSELLQISRKVRNMDRNAMKNAITVHLKRSRYLRQQLAVLANKRSALEQHLDTLDTSELNQQVITSMRQTSTALKAMGLDQAQTQADGLLMDMEESMQDMHNITKLLSTPLQEDLEIDSGVLDNELSLLLMEDDDEVACVSVSMVNSMNASSVVSHTPKPRPAAEAQAPAQAVEAEKPADTEEPAEPIMSAERNN